MRNSSSNRRNRSSRNNGRSNGGNNGGGNQRTKVYDSNGPDVRIRGTAHQVIEKYIALAKDASSSGDRILEESYLQHAEHYQRIVGEWSQDVQDAATGKKHVQSNDQKAEDKAKQPTKSKTVNSDDDLGLPSSILGGDSQVKSEANVSESAN